MLKRSIAVVVAVMVVSAVIWWLFGWREYSLLLNEATGPGAVREQRFFGRIVRVSVDSNADGRWDQISYYSWSEPFVQHEPGARAVTDSDYDGRWDVWERPADRGDPLLRHYSIDTDFDGNPDVELDENPTVVWERIRVMRSNQSLKRTSEPGGSAAA